MRFTILLLLFGSPFACFAQGRPIDAKDSSITIHAYKSGVFSFAGHDHVISAPISSGTLDTDKRTISFTVVAKDMQVLDPGESEKNKTEIRDTMLGPKLLDAEKYPEIKFHSIDIRQVNPATFEVRGELMLHGVTRTLTMKVTKEGGRYTGQTKLKQTDYGLTPVAVAGGTVKVKDEVMIEFTVKQ